MAVLKRLVLLLCLVATALGQQTPSPLGGGLSLDDEDDLLEWHNLKRSSVNPLATDMLEMVPINLCSMLLDKRSYRCGITLSGS